VALGLRTIATGSSLHALPPGPIFGMKVEEIEDRRNNSGKREQRSDQNLEMNKNDAPLNKREKSPEQERKSVKKVQAREKEMLITPKEVLKKHFPTYEDSLLDRVLSQNDHNLIKTIQKLGSNHAHMVHSKQSGHK
jgi:hypothetical protein